MGQQRVVSKLSLLPAALLALVYSVPVVAGLDEADASQVVVALEQSGVASEKERDPEQEGSACDALGMVAA